MKRPQLALIISTLLLVTCLPWLAFSQMGGMGGGGGMGGMSGGMGGMGGGMGGMGGGGMGGMVGGGMGPREIVSYQRPAGPPPSWLTNGLDSINSSERLREQLNQYIRIEQTQEKLTDLVTTLREHGGNGIDVDIDSTAIEESGIEFESCRGLPAGEGPLRELLIRTLDQQQLAYRVLENHIQITTKEAAIDNPTICYYDLAFVQTNSELLGDIIAAIEGSIDPDFWSSNGGEGSIITLGQLLVVRATESSHQEIERMLARLSLTMSVDNDEDDVEGDNEEGGMELEDKGDDDKGDDDKGDDDKGDDDKDEGEGDDKGVVPSSL